VGVWTVVTMLILQVSTEVVRKIVWTRAAVRPTRTNAVAMLFLVLVPE